MSSEDVLLAAVFIAAFAGAAVGMFCGLVCGARAVLAAITKVVGPR
jgi:hypothetical protein